MPDSTSIKAPVPLVAIAGWLIPGAGYWLIGQRSRALTIGIAVIAIYLAGLLVGGVRVIEVPGYDEQGQHVMIKLDNGRRMWALAGTPLQEVKAKPWAIAQVLAGPMGIASGVASVWAAQPVELVVDGETVTQPLADVTHTPVNEAGTLYTAVAGMLNLLAIIDAAHRVTLPAPDEGNQ